MDFSYLLSISDGDKEFISQFIATFKKNTTNILEAMDKSFGEKDFETLGKQAHQLKPSLEMLKLESYDTCLDIQNNPDKTTVEKLESIKDSCKEAADEMTKEFNL